jgi:hypothetical protein
MGESVYGRSGESRIEEFGGGGLSNLGSALLTQRLGRAKFPEDLAEDAEHETSIGGREVQAANESTNFFFDGGG